jgi:hypothetical protein
MPGRFKIEAQRTDAVNVSDTVVNETTNAFLLDGDAPRLGTNWAPMLPNVPPASSFGSVDSGPTLPVVSQLLTDGSAPTLPTLPVSAPTPTAPESTDPAADSLSTEQRHPMAHLMPEKIKPSAASLRAAEARSVKKKKAKKVKIIVGVCVLAVTAVVGPPLAKWTIDAINEAGKVSTDEPEVTPTAPAPQVPSVDNAGVQAIDDAQQLASNTTPAAAP